MAFLVGALMTLGMAACGDNNNQVQPDASPGADAPAVDEPPATYRFDSRFQADESSVSYTGQIIRHVLISEMKSYIGSLTDDIDTGVYVPTAGDVALALDFYYRFDSGTSGQVPLTLTTDPPLLQTVYDDISTDKNLAAKFAGNDPVGQHQDWTTAFVGWDPGQASTPEGLLDHFFARLDEQASARALGDIPVDPDGNAIPVVYVTADGLDLRELIQKFLLGAVAYSQGTDDYLDSDLEDHGINVSNTQDGDSPYTILEHHWDEAYGYFGAARDYNDYTDDEAAAADGRPEYASGYHDSDGDGAIDLGSEYIFGNAQNASKRDRDSADAAPTDFSRGAMDAFLAGRYIISSAPGELDQEQMTALLAQRDQVVDNWERAISATIVHYINEVVRDMNAFGTAEYSFLDHAKHWSEMKGFALGLQFNPRSQVSAENFALLHTYMGDAPVLGDADPADIDTYRMGLISARDLLGQSYNFDPANLGDDNGENGW